MHRRQGLQVTSLVKQSSHWWRRYRQLSREARGVFPPLLRCAQTPLTTRVPVRGDVPAANRDARKTFYSTPFMLFEFSTMGMNKIITILLLMDTLVVFSFLLIMLEHSCPCLLVQMCKSFSKVFGSPWLDLPSDLFLALLLTCFVLQEADPCRLCASGFCVHWVW